AARLPAFKGRSGSPAIHHGGYLHPRDHRPTSAPFLVDQRVEGVRGCPWPTAWHRTDPGGLVLRRGAGRGPGTHYRPGVFPADRRHRALAVPPGAQARRPPARGMALRFSVPPPQVGQPGPAQRLRLRPARVGYAAVAAGVRAVHRTPTRFAGNPGVSACAAHDTLITAGQAVNGLVLSGVRAFVLSGASDSCHQAYAFSASSMITGRALLPNVILNNQYLYLTFTYPLGQWISRTSFSKQCDASGRVPT